MENISEILDNLRNVRTSDPTIQRMVKILFSMYETIEELQSRIRELENEQVQPVMKVKLKVPDNKEINDTHSIDKETE